MLSFLLQILADVFVVITLMKIVFVDYLPVKLFKTHVQTILEIVKVVCFRFVLDTSGKNYYLII